MKLQNLTEDETNTVYTCLKCVAGGKVIHHDVEFYTIMGIEIEEFLDIYKKWPNILETKTNVMLGINNSMNNLLGYPHGKYEQWDEVMEISLKEIERVFKKWRGENAS